MSLVLVAIGAGLVLAAVGAFAVARMELKAGAPPRPSARLVLSALQVYLSTWTIVQVAADVVLSAAPLDQDAAELSRTLVRVTLAAAVLWAPFALGTLVIAALTYRRGERELVATPLFAAATYLVALFAILASGWLEGPLGG
jgi:hypothetical protein